MTLKLDLPAEVVEALGEEPEHEVLEAVLLFLINEDRISVARAGWILGLSRLEAVRWYTGYGFDYPDLSEEELTEEIKHARSS